MNGFKSLLNTSAGRSPKRASLSARANRKPQIILYYESGKPTYWTPPVEDVKFLEELVNDINRDIIRNRLDPNFMRDKRRSSLTFLDLKNQFIAHRKQQVKLGTKSAETLKKDIETFNIALPIIGHNTPLLSIDRQMIDQWRLALKEKKTRFGTPFANTTINIYTRTLKAAFSWAVIEGLIDRSPFHSIKPLPEQKKRGKALSPEEIELLRSAAGAPERPPGWLELVNFLLWTGCRASSVVKANRENLFSEEIDDSKRLFLKVQEKFSKVRIIPLPDRCYQLLQKRLEIIADPDKVDKLLDATISGKKLEVRQKYYSLSRSGFLFFEYSRVDSVSHVIGKLARAAKIQATTHDLRHTYVTNYRQRAGKVDILKDILGHSDIKTTEIYLHSNTALISRNIDYLTDI